MAHPDTCESYFLIRNRALHCGRWVWKVWLRQESVRLRHRLRTWNRVYEAWGI